MEGCFVTMKPIVRSTNYVLLDIGPTLPTLDPVLLRYAPLGFLRIRTMR